MNTLFRLGMILLLGASLAMAGGFSKTGKSGGLTVEYGAEKPLAAGNNPMSVKLSYKGKPVEGADVTLKYFMPEMPGMPYMEYQDQGKEIAPGVYEIKINFAMGGTWQGRLYIITKDGKKFLHKSSVIL